MKKRMMQLLAAVVIIATIVSAVLARQAQTARPPFNVVEATIDDIHKAFKAGTLTSRQLVQMYLDRIEAYDKNGPDDQFGHHAESESP